MENSIGVRSSLIVRLLGVVVGFALLVVAIVVGARYVLIAQDFAIEKAREQYGKLVGMVTRTEYVKQYVSLPELPLDDLVKKAAKDNKVPVLALQAIVFKESSNGEQLYRFEPKLFEKFLLNKDMKQFTTDEIRQLASSHGVAHVLGATARVECGIHWSKLYNPAIGMDCGAKYLRKKLDDLSSIKDPSEKLWQAFHNYNSGSTNSGGYQADAYADSAMAWVGKKLYAQLKEEM